MLKKILRSITRIFVGVVIAFLILAFGIVYVMESEVQTLAQNEDAEELLTLVEDYIKGETTQEFSIYRSYKRKYLKIQVVTDGEISLSEKQIQEIKSLIKSDIAYKKVIFEQYNASYNLPEDANPVYRKEQLK